MNILEAKNIAMEFDNGHVEGAATKVLNDIDISVNKGELVVIVGPSGCGKTTFFNIIAGFKKPTEGEILLKYLLVTEPTKRIGVIFQEPRLFPWLKVDENIGFGLYDKPDEEKEKQIQRYLELVGLEEFREYYPHEISGGMKQRVALARSLAVEPEVLLMDEPFGALDPKTRDEMQRTVLRIRKELGTTILFITHNIEEAVFLADRLCIFTPLPAKIADILDKPQGLPQSKDGFSEKTSTQFIKFEHKVMQIMKKSAL